MNWFSRRKPKIARARITIDAVMFSPSGLRPALAAGSAIALDDAAREILLRLPDLDEVAALALTDRFRGGEGAANFSLFLERLAERVHEMARERASARIGGLDPWAQAWERLTALPREVEAAVSHDASAKPRRRDCGCE